MVLSVTKYMYIVILSSENGKKKVSNIVIGICRDLIDGLDIDFVIK